MIRQRNYKINSRYYGFELAGNPSEQVIYRKRQKFMKEKILLAEYDRYLSYFNNQGQSWVEQHLDALDFRSRAYATQVARLLHETTGGEFTLITWKEGAECFEVTPCP